MTSFGDTFGPALVLDASVVINFLAIEDPANLLGLLPSPTVVAQVADEILRHPVTGLPGASAMTRLLVGPLRRAALDGPDAELLVELVGAPSPDDLDDGEAATIAFAATRGFTAVIDERKAQRIIARRPKWRTLTTVGVYRELLSSGALDRKTVAAYVFDSLRHARMRVVAAEMPWVSDLLAPTQLAACPSLRRYHRE